METTLNKGFSFGDFELITDHRLLLKHGEAVPLNPKTFDLLLVLVENHGRVLSKSELLDTVWQDQFVEENNLTVHISALRKVFGEKKGDHRFIVTIPGRGYKFVASVESKISFKESENGVMPHPAAPEKETDKKLISHSEKTEISGFHIDGAGELIGREREIEEIKNLLRRADLKLVTLTGTGGTGKTRLAKAAARELASDFADGVFFIELAEIKDAGQIAPAIAQTLGIKESGTMQPFEALKDYLRERRILLALDNFEQLLPVGASLVKEIIQATHFLKVFVTSRAALQLEIENEVLVAPLSVPPLRSGSGIDELEKFASVALFVARAKTAKPGFDLSEANAPSVANICRKLDGLPLAVELAAARVRFLSPAAILDRLAKSLKLLTGGSEDAAARQRTMRNAIQWSYELLAENEKHLFRRLSVFAGEFSIEAAEALAETENEINEITKIDVGADVYVSTLDLIVSLINVNLLATKEQPDGGIRLRMLEVVREFALECLETSGEASILRQKHARYFLALAEEAEQHLMDERSVEWLEKLDAENDNLRAALYWSLEKDSEIGMRTASALRYFWIFRSYLNEGGKWLDSALEKGIAAPRELRFKLLCGRAILARVQGDYPTSRKLYEQGLTEGRAAGDLQQIAKSSAGLGTVLQIENDFSGARKYFTESLKISRELNDEQGMAYSLICLGIAARNDEKPAESRLYLEEALDILKKFGSKEAISNNLNNLAAASFEQGDLEAAHIYFAEGLAMAREVGNKVNIADALHGFAALAGKSGNSERAAKLAGAAEHLRKSIGYDLEPAERRFCEDYLARLRTAMDEKPFTDAFEKGVSLTLYEAAALAEETETENHAASARNFAEIIIEKHSFSRIVVEEEIEDKSNPLTSEIIYNRNNRITNGQESPDRAAALLTESAFSNLPKPRSLNTAVFVALAILLMTGTFFFWYFGNFNLYDQNHPGVLAVSSTQRSPILKSFSTAGGIPHRVAISPDGKWAAYVQRVRGLDSIWLGDLEQNTSIRITPESERLHEFLVFAPDGKSVYFTGRDENHLLWTLMRVSVFGGAVQDLTKGVHSTVTFSPDSKQFAFLRKDRDSDRKSLIIADTETGKNERVLSHGNERENIAGLAAAWSPEGKQIAVWTQTHEKEFRIKSVNVESGALEKIGETVFDRGFHLVWLADGSGLLLNAQPTGEHGKPGQIWLLSYPKAELKVIERDQFSYSGYNLSVSADDKIALLQSRVDPNIYLSTNSADASGATVILSGSRVRTEGAHGLTIAPDEKILFAASVGDSRTIWEMHPDSSNQKQLTPFASGSNDSQISVTPDNRFLIFESNRSGANEIWRANRDGTDLRALTSGGGNSAPAVTPEGAWIVYTALRDGRETLWRVSIEGGEPDQITDQYASWADVSPDGKFIACAWGKYTDADNRRIAVIDFQTGEVKKIFQTTKHAILYNRMRWSPDGKSIYYKDNIQGLWRQDLNKETPEAIKGFGEIRVFHFAFSPLTKNLIYSGGIQMREIVILENFRARN